MSPTPKRATDGTRAVTLSARSDTKRPSVRSETSLRLVQSVFVWAVWGAMFVMALAFVRAYGSNVPGVDEWHLVSHVAGAKPVTWTWLWEPFNEHRVVLPRLLVVQLTRLFRFDFRAGMYINVVALATLAALLVLTARRLRGHVAFSDAFFPIAILHLGHWQNYLQGWNVQNVAITALSGVVLTLTVCRSGGLSLGRSMGVGVCLLLLPLSGVAGAVLAFPLSLWLFVACAIPSSTTSRLARGIGVAFALGAIAVVLIGYGLGIKETLLSPHMRQQSEQRITAVQAATNGLRFLSLGMGCGIQSANDAYGQRPSIYALGNAVPAPQVWPVSGWLAILMLLAAFSLVEYGWWRQPGDWRRASGMLLFGAGVIALALAVGWGRASDGPATMFRSRYAALAVPLWCAVYFVGVLYGPPVLGRAHTFALFLVATFTVLGSSREGHYWGKKTRAVYEAFENDLAAKVPPQLLAESHFATIHIPFHPSARPEIEDGLTDLARAGGRWAREVAKPLACRGAGVAINSATPVDITFHDGAGYGTGRHAALVFSLPQPTPVIALRFDILLADRNPIIRPSRVRVSWREVRSEGVVEREKFIDADTGSEPHQLVVWINATIDRFAIHPDVRPFVFRITTVTLLVPENPSGAEKNQ